MTPPCRAAPAARDVTDCNGRQFAVGRSGGLHFAFSLLCAALIQRTKLQAEFSGDERLEAEDARISRVAGFVLVFVSLGMEVD